MKKAKRRAVYAVIEGVEASGKTSVVEAMYRIVGDSFDAFKAPSTNGEVGKFIRDVFEGKRRVSERAMLHLFAADTIDQEELLAERMRLGRSVVVDRHNLVSAMVYQTEVHSEQEVRMVNPRSMYLSPDLFVLLDVSPLMAATRLARRKAQQTDGKYKTRDVDVICQRVKAYRSAFAELESDGWAKESMLVSVEKKTPDIIALEIIETMEELAERV